jgi:hypothetical protein
MVTGSRARTMPAPAAPRQPKDPSLVQRASCRGILEGGEHPIRERLPTIGSDYYGCSKCKAWRSRSHKRNTRRRATTYVDSAL